MGSTWYINTSLITVTKRALNMIDVGIFFKHSWKLGYANLNLDILQSQMHPNEMLLISHPGQVCLVRPG